MSAGRARLRKATARQGSRFFVFITSFSVVAASLSDCRHSFLTIGCRSSWKSENNREDFNTSQPPTPAAQTEGTARTDLRGYQVLNPAFFHRLKTVAKSCVFGDTFLESIDGNLPFDAGGPIQRDPSSLGQRLLFLRFLRQLEAFSFRNVSPTIRKNGQESCGEG